MANFSRVEVINAVLSEGLIPIFYHSDLHVAKEVLLACMKGGAVFFEFTNRGDFAIEVFRELSHFCQSQAKDIILGAGTVYDEHTAALFIANGANFIVSPFSNDNIAYMCNKHKIPYIPGCATTTEISRAEEVGAEIIKLYPASSIGGPDFIKTVLGPMPRTRIMPTGGIKTEYDDLEKWFDSGIAAVGIGGDLIKSKFVKTGDYDSITTQVSQVTRWIKQFLAKRLT